MRMFSALLGAQLALLALHCAASPFSTRIGLERVVLDLPPGFSDTIDLASPRLQDLSQALTSASNRIVMFGVTDADFRKFTAGEFLDFRRYVLAATPKAMERSRVSAEQFDLLVADALRGLGKPNEPPDLIKFLVQQPIGQVNLLAELRKQPMQVSVLQATRLPPVPGRMFESDKPQYLVFSTTIVLVAGKAMQLAVYSLYDGPQDTEWVKGITLRWIDELLRLNPR